MKLLTYIILLAVSFSLSTQSQTESFNHSKFDMLLKNNVDENGMVNYNGFMNNDDFYNYLNSIANVNVEDLPDNDKLAFYLNAYNATVIKNIIDHWPVESPMDVDGFFNTIKYKILGKELTLDELEHEYALKIESVLSHFGLVCAAISCPKLLRNAYDGNTVYQQLRENAETFLNDQEKNSLDKENKILHLSSIFKWFKNSFVNKYGSLQNTAAEFMNKTDSDFIKSNEVEIKFNKYIWDLNSQ